MNLPLANTDMILKRTSTEEVLLIRKEDILHPLPLHPLVIKKIIREENLLMRRNPDIVRKETNKKRKVKEDFRKSGKERRRKRRKGKENWRGNKVMRKNVIRTSPRMKLTIC